MNSKIKLYIYLLIILAMGGCKNSFDEAKVSRGNADFSRFIALGGYYAAGYADGALHYEVQKNSFPSILAGRFSLVGGAEFRQPAVNPGAGLGYDDSKYLVS